MTQRTTIRLKGELLDQAKRRAAEQGRTLTAFIEDAVRAELTAPKKAPLRRPLPLVKGEGLQPGVDINDNTALADIMDGLEPR